MSVKHLNPDGMHRNPAFSQAVAVTGAHTTLYIGGQDAVNEKGEVVGEGDIAAQTRQIFRNLRTILEAAGGKLEHIVKWNIYVVAGTDIMPAVGVFGEVWDRHVPPPIITTVFVAALGHPAWLCEIEAVAVIPE
jgi:enamine deaminase RidA (YjgF/YER057c/UK114 family)